MSPQTGGGWDAGHPLVVGPADLEACGGMTLDAAWAEAEAALPEWWVMALHSKVVGLWAACAYDHRWTHDSVRGVVVDTPDGPVAALRDLTRKLREYVCTADPDCPLRDGHDGEHGSIAEPGQ